jgi:hypothetical protein
MSTSSSASDLDAAKLRLRTSSTTAPSGTPSAQETVRELNATEAQADKDEKDRKTYGRTPDGKGKQFESQRQNLVMSTPSFRQEWAWRFNRDVLDPSHPS